MNVIISTGTFPGYQLSNIFRLVRATNADGVEFLLSPRLGGIPAGYVRELERQHGVPVRSVHTTLRLRAVDDHVIRHDILRSVRFASAFDQCQTLVVHTPNAESLHEERARNWFSAVEVAAEIARDAGLRVAVENSGRVAPDTPTGAFDHPNRLKSLAQEWDLNLTFDTAHAGSRGWNLLEAAQLLLPGIANVHLSDLGRRSTRFGLVNSLARDHKLPGDGTLPLDDLLILLGRSHYSGLLTLEISPLAAGSWWPPRAERLLREAVSRCRLITSAAQLDRARRRPRTTPAPSDLPKE